HSGEGSFHKGTGGDETGIEEHGADDGLHRIGEHRLFCAAAGHLFAPAHFQVTAEIEGGGNIGKGLSADDAVLHQREIALGQIGVLAKEMLNYGKAEDGIAKKLKRLIVPSDVRAAA